MTLDIYRNSAIIKSVVIDEKTTIARRLMIEDTLTLGIDTAASLPLAVGDYVIIDGCRYELSDNPDYALTDGVYSYNAVFYGSIHLLDRYLMPDEGKDEFYYFGTMAEHVAFVLAEILKKEAGWSASLPAEITPDMTKPLNINYAGCTLLGAVRKLCDKDAGYNLEFDIENKRITFATEIRRPTSVSFSYGRGKGLYKISRGKLSGESIVTRLYGYGGTTNMMLGSRLTFEGGYVEKNVDKYGLREGKITFDNIYPRRNSTLTSGAVQVSAGSAIWSVADTAIDFDLNAQTLENAQIMFTDGDCAGLSFAISKYNHTTKTVTFKEIAYENQSPTYVVPNPDRKPKAGDSYAFTGIIMPDSYVTAAKAELAAATAAEVAKRSVPQHPYTVECDPRFFKGKDYRPRPGDLCRLKDTGNALDAEIRISGVEFPLITPFACKLTISDKVPIPTSVILEKKVDNATGKVEIIDLAQQQNARRQAGALNELSNYLLDSEGYFDAAKFKALSIEARMLTIGLTAQNFTLSGVTVTPNYGNVSTVNITAGKLVHNIINTDGFNGIWNIAGATLSAASTSKAYYLYARCSKNTPSATLHLAETEPAVDAEDNYYLFNIGVLYPQRPGEDYRDFQSTKGVTNIVGDQIYTGVIRALDNFNFINLRPVASAGRFRLGRSNCSMDFGVTAPDTLSMRGVKIINQGGDAALLPVWRGDWSNLPMYYAGDEVFWNGSTYRCLQNTPTAGIMPINTTYWKLSAAKGDKGDKGYGIDSVGFQPVNLLKNSTEFFTGPGNVVGNAELVPYNVYVPNSIKAGKSYCFYADFTELNGLYVPGVGVIAFGEVFTATQDVNKILGRAPAGVTFRQTKRMALYETTIPINKWVPSEWDNGRVFENLFNNSRDFYVSPNAFGNLIPPKISNISNKDDLSAIIYMLNNRGISPRFVYINRFDGRWFEYDFGEPFSLYGIQALYLNVEPGISGYSDIVMTTNIQYKGTSYAQSQADTAAEIATIANRQLEAEAITKNFTSIDGGLLLTTLIKLLDNNIERGGFNGLAKGADPAIWFGGSYADALAATEAVRIILRANGSSRLGELDISATGKLGLGGDKVILTKDNIDALSSMLGSAVSGTTNNAAASSSVTEERVLPNALTVTRDNSTLTVSTYISARASVPFDQVDSSGASFTASLYLQYPDLSRVLLGSVMANAGGRDVHGNPIDQRTESFTVNHLEVAKAGTYKLILKTTKGFIMGLGLANGGVATSTMSFRYDLAQGRFMVGRNGLALVKDANKYLYCSVDDTNAFFQVKGKTDMPGVLRAGAVNEVGAIAGNWGAKDCTCIRPNGETGRYRITHSIGHTNYYVAATPYSNNTTTIENKTTSYVDVVVHQNTGGKINCGFDFMICGSN